MANEYSVNQADLTAVADAIRAKAESSEALSFPSGFVDAIANLETGGGLPSNVSALATGTIIPVDSPTTLTIEHGMGVTPNFYLIVTFKKFEYKVDTNKIFYVTGSAINNTKYQTQCYYNNGTTIQTSGGYGNPLGNNSTFTTYSGSSTRTFLDGSTYYWICGVLGE